jgi:hypothetical protein
MTRRGRSTHARVPSIRARPGRRAFALTVVAGATLAVAAAALALPPFSFAPRVSAPAGNAQAEVYGLRIACHPTFDRFVVLVRFATPGYRVQYVPRVIHDGSGDVVRLRGTRRLRVILGPARAHTADTGAALVPNLVNASCPQLLQLKSAGDFEGVVTYGIGVRQLRPFRVFRLTGPTRIVIDIRH